MTDPIAEGVKLVPELQRKAARSKNGQALLETVVNKTDLKTIIASLTAAGEMARELAEAREALKPFKDRLFDRTTFEEALYGKKYWAADSVEIYVPIGDLRRAARAYANKGEPT